MAREINLVPDVKGEMIKALKLRNFILFLCIVVAIASVSVTLILGAIAGAQQAAVDGKKSTITSLSSKVKSYSDLTDFLTIKDQLGNLEEISNNKKVLSRTFNILSAIIPTGADTITISELSVNLTESQPVLSFDAQANAGREPYIDYNVLDSFKKSMEYMRYDYGRYVDKDNNKIPAYCMIESNSDGSIFTDETKGIYAFWTIDADGCNPASDNKLSDSDSGSNSVATLEPTAKSSTKSSTESDDATESSSTKSSSSSNYTYEEYEGQNVVRIWRTPQFTEWYDNKYMTESGTISGVPHFASNCITYSANEDERGTLKWTSTNDTCELVPGGIEGIKTSGDSNGRVGETEELVLRFTARITLSSEVYKFNNKHVLAFGPEGRHNVTDSYTQIQAMFSERAADCSDDDEACKNKGGE